MSTFIVTSDWHIGAPMESAGRASKMFREEKYNVAKRIAQVVDKKKAKALFILGDLFDSDRVGESDILQTSLDLAKVSCPVYVIPGNHDWWHQGGVLHRFSRLSEKQENINILLEDLPFTVKNLPNVTFFPSPLRRKNPIHDTSEWIPTRTKKDGLRVALLHGTIDTYPNGKIPSNVTNIRDLDLTFLGDLHKPDKVDDKTYYCGSPEPGGFDEGHEGQVLAVEVEGDKTNVESTIVGKLAWKRIEIKLESREVGGLGCQSLKQAIESISSPPETTAIRLHLFGTLSWDELNELDQFLIELQMYGWANVDLEDVRVERMDEVKLEKFPDAVRTVAQKILDADKNEVVKRKALVILKSKLEDIQ